ncbi:DUF4131 domain-containing protein [Xylophilus sp.]|uniref:DUF4131 domain-containing protein n=1 Tax=Xylophilus sp. TaxID=2653893 RepID=UPI0013BD6111|nr:MAG: hypothetical protein GAK38_00901 [Xylophilus sp.]
MPTPLHRSRPALPLAWLLAGFVGGTAWQLQQAALALRPSRPLAVLALVAGLAAGFGTAGLRACAFAADALAPALEGRDLRVEGTVAAMPQPSDAGLRLRLEVDARRGWPTAAAMPRSAFHRCWTWVGMPSTARRRPRCGLASAGRPLCG